MVTKRDPGYKPFTWYLDTAKNRTKMAYAGEVIQVIDASAPSANILIQLDDPDAPQIKMKLHDLIVLPFHNFHYSWTAQTGHWVKVLISDSPQKRFFFGDAVANFDGKPRLITNISVTSTISSVISPTKEVSKFVLVNDPASADPLYIGDSALAPSGTKLGDIILPTERKVFKGVNESFQIYARCKTGESANLGVIEYD